MGVTTEVFFSIILATYNRATFISKAVESVLDQDFVDWELIVIDDGSTDNTREMIHKYQDARIRYFFQNNGGRSKARNKGIDVAKGKFLCFIDDDDWYYSTFLQKMYKFILRKNEVNALYLSAQNYYNEDYNIIGQSKLWDSPDAVRYILRSSNNLLSVAISTQILDIYRFDERFEIGEDFHLMLRIALNFPVYYLDEALVAYLSHPESSMEKEISELLFTKIPYNRLDVMKSLEDCCLDKIVAMGNKTSFYQKFNKIRYFYASALMKNGDLRKASSIIFGLDWIDTKSFFYFLSILVRFPFFLKK